VASGPVDQSKAIQLLALGRAQLEPMMTHRFPLDGINEALGVLRRGQGLRTIVTP
jgi:Zn-dependent alcohol dehydrogenase